MHDEICTEQHIQTNDDTKDLNLWPDPEEITAELLKVEALEDELIPEPFQAWIKDISNRMQCPVDYPSAAAIVLCSILVGTRCSIRPKSKDSWQVVPNLWGAIVGNPSTLKTPSIQEATKMLSKLENKAFEKFDEEQIQYQRDLRTWEMKKKIIEDELKNAYKSKKSDSVEAKEVESRLNEHEDNPPKESILKRYSTSDSTVPKLQELMSFNPQGVFVFRDELHGFLMSLEQEGREADRAFHLEGWDGQGSFTSDRIGRGTVRSDLVCESVFGSIQPARIIPHIRQTLSGSANDGLVQRFQVLVYPDVDKWSYIDKTPDQEAQNRAYRLIQKLNDMDFVNDARAVLEDGNKIPYMRFSEDAQELFKVWITDLESRLRNNEETP
ncbi:MAG: YfjI family protein, partial [SAR324 cluster bacterium]|nr:YfjI family protein [SAR324 cluster bacterium]